MLIDIPVIKELAVSASIGVWVLGWTNLVLLPILLSYTGVSEKAARRSLREENEIEQGRGLGSIWKLLNRFTERRRITSYNVCYTKLLRDDIEPSKSGEFGLSARWSPEWMDATVGFYYRRFADKQPAVVLDARGVAAIGGTPGQPVGYRLSYGDDIDLYGISLSKNSYNFV